MVDSWVVFGSWMDDISWVVVGSWVVDISWTVEISCVVDGTWLVGSLLFGVTSVVDELQAKSLMIFTSGL